MQNESYLNYLTKEVSGHVFSLSYSRTTMYKKNPVYSQSATAFQLINCAFLSAADTSVYRIRAPIFIGVSRTALKFQTTKTLVQISWLFTPKLAKRSVVVWYFRFKVSPATFAEENFLKELSVGRRKRMLRTCERGSGLGAERRKIFRYFSYLSRLRTSRSAAQH